MQIADCTLGSGLRRVVVHFCCGVVIDWTCQRVREHPEGAFLANLAAGTAHEDGERCPVAGCNSHEGEIFRARAASPHEIDVRTPQITRYDTHEIMIWHLPPPRHKKSTTQYST